MSFKSIKLLPLLLVFGLVTALGACSASEEATSPDNSLEQEGIIEAEGAGAIVEAE